jgi:hypothetical protein
MPQTEADASVVVGVMLPEARVSESSAENVRPFVAGNRLRVRGFGCQRQDLDPALQLPHLPVEFKETTSVGVVGPPYVVALIPQSCDSRGSRIVENGPIRRSLPGRIFSNARSSRV